VSVVNVERVLQRLGIEAKRSGKEWVALCPNPEHKDRSPSWRIRDEPGATKHGYHHCWPCGLKGTAIDLVQFLLKIEERKDAKAWIEREASVEQKEVVGVEVKVKPPRLGFHLPPEVVVAPLDEWPETVRRYLPLRGIEDWQVDRWGLGYAVEGRLRGRIVVISRDALGRPQRYTARSFADAEKRYLEPNPEEGANQNAMFGEQHWPAIGGSEPRDTLFVVEGAVNGLALEAELPGIYVGATAGSSMRPMYGTKLATWKRLCVMTDPDAAGDKLAREIADTGGRHAVVERLRLEEGFDPAKLRVLRPGNLGAIVRAWLMRR
jgi:hypothetical protein